MDWLTEYRGRISAALVALGALLAEITGMIDAIGKALGG